MKKPRLLLTRPADEVGRGAELARAAGFDPVCAPLLVIERLDFRLPDGKADALLFTSPRAPQELARHAPETLALPAYCVGPRTAQAAVRAGFAVEGQGESDGNAILRHMAGRGCRDILHPRGENHIELQIPEGLSLLGVAVYRAKAVPLPPETVQALQKGDMLATLLFSPRTARIFRELVESAGIQRESLALVALSHNVAESAGPGWQAVEVAARPTLEEALAAARRLWQGKAHG